MGLEVRRGPDGNINVVQPPGAANALGRIKFNFPNKFQVYLHDTPEKRLFSYEKRAFSPWLHAGRGPDQVRRGNAAPGDGRPDADLAADQPADRPRREDFTLQSRPTVHLTYQTAYVDDSGKLIQREDLYGFDARINAILNSDERKVADVAPPQDRSARLR